jgi:hypothetical protein
LDLGRWSLDLLGMEPRWVKAAPEPADTPVRIRGETSAATPG